MAVGNPPPLPDTSHFTQQVPADTTNAEPAYLVKNILTRPPKQQANPPEPDISHTTSGPEILTNNGSSTISYSGEQAITDNAVLTVSASHKMNLRHLGRFRFHPHGRLDSGWQEKVRRGMGNLRRWDEGPIPGISETAISLYCQLARVSRPRWLRLLRMQQNTMRMVWTIIRALVLQMIRG